MSAPLILVHGAFCGGWAFDEMRAGLERAGLRAAAPDLPGRGPGESSSGLGLAAYTRAVAATVAACAEPPVLVGHSMGGLVAQLAAARSRVAGLVLLAPSPAWGEPVTSPMELAAAISLPASGLWWGGTLPPDWSVVRDYTLDRLPEAEARAIHARMAPESGRALSETLNWALDPLMSSRVPPLSLPALVLTGERDRVHPAETTAATARRLGARQAVLPGVSHWTLGGPGAAAGVELMLEWLAGL